MIKHLCMFVVNLCMFVLDFLFVKHLDMLVGILNVWLIAKIIDCTFLAC